MQIKRSFKRLTSVLLAVMMTAGLFVTTPLTASAAGVINVSTAAQLLAAIENAQGDEYVIPQSPTTIRFTNNITYDGNEGIIKVFSSNVIFDLNGYTLTSGTGIDLQFSRVQFINGNIKVLSMNGITHDYYSVRCWYSVVDIRCNMTLHHGAVGIELYGIDESYPTIMRIFNNVTVTGKASYIWAGSLYSVGDISGGDGSIETGGSEADVTVIGTVTGKVVCNGGDININGNVYSADNNAEKSEGSFASFMMTTASVNDYWQEDALVYAGTEASVTITGSVYASGEDKVGVWAENGAEVNVGGSIYVDGTDGLGVWAKSYSYPPYVYLITKITVNGSVYAATPFISDDMSTITVEDEDTDEPAVLDRIRIVNLPDNMEYAVGDTLDLSGLAVSAVYSDESERDVTGSVSVVPANGTVLSSVGTVGVTISYTEDGVTETTVFSVTVNPQAHVCDYQKTVTPPSCEEQGYTTYVCDCGESYISDYVPALGHREGAGRITVSPTATTEGAMTYYCTICGVELRTAVIPALGVGNRITICGVELEYRIVNGIAILEPTEAQMMAIIKNAGKDIVIDLRVYDGVDMRAAAGWFKDVDKTITIITSKGSDTVKTKTLWNNSGKDRLITVRNGKASIKNI